MKIMGIITENFSVYYDIVKILKAKKIAFISLSFKDKIPHYVGAVITTKEEKNLINFKKKVIFDGNAEKAVAQALAKLEGMESFSKIVIGIDPGDMPGIAVLGDKRLIYKHKATSPENVKNVVREIIDSYSFLSAVIKIGHGAVTLRNRIINSLLEIGIEIEIVDETNTTIKTEEPDIHAAIDIANSKGKKVERYYEIKPTNGELNEIKRRSRLKSKGRITISKELAEKVAKGEITLDEAIERQQGSKLIVKTVSPQLK